MQSINSFSRSDSSRAIMAPPMQQEMNTSAGGPVVRSLSEECSAKVCVTSMGGAVATLGVVALGAGIVKGTGAIICLGGIASITGFGILFGGCSMKD